MRTFTGGLSMYSVEEGQHGLRKFRISLWNLKYSLHRGLKESKRPDSDAISRSSRSSDDTVRVDAVFGSLLWLWASVMHFHRAETQEKGIKYIYRLQGFGSENFQKHTQRGAYQGWTEIPNSPQNSHCHWTLFSLKEREKKWNEGKADGLFLWYSRYEGRESLLPSLGRPCGLSSIRW